MGLTRSYTSPSSRRQPSRASLRKVFCCVSALMLVDAASSKPSPGACTGSWESGYHGMSAEQSYLCMAACKCVTVSSLAPLILSHGAPSHTPSDAY